MEGHLSNRDEPEHLEVLLGVGGPGHAAVPEDVGQGQLHGQHRVPLAHAVTRPLSEGQR